jgi:hypothetical protein
VERVGDEVLMDLVNSHSSIRSQPATQGVCPMVYFYALRLDQVASFLPRCAFEQPRRLISA